MSVIDDDENFLPDDEESADDIGCAFAFLEECPPGCEDCPFDQQDIAGFAYVAIQEGMDTLKTKKCLSGDEPTEEQINELYEKVYETYIGEYVLYAINSFNKPLTKAFTCPQIRRFFSEVDCQLAATVAIDKMTEIDFQINQQ